MQTEPDQISGVERPTRVRFIVLAWLASLAFILYLDRICMSQAVTPIIAEMDITNTQMSAILMAFTLAYGLFEVPSGHWGDRIGSRRVLGRIVIWWSTFTALTGACTGFFSLLFIRFLFGAGEAGAFPNTARVISRWFPVGERGRIQGFLLAGSLIGAATAPKLTAQLITLWGWRWTFVLFGAIGALWTFFFLRSFRDEPADHPAVNGLELAAIRGPHLQTSKTPATHPPLPWKQAFRNRNIWLLSANIACMSFTSYLFFSWYSNYLQKGRDQTNESAGTLVSCILGAGAVGMMAGGWLADRLGTSRLRRRQAIVVDALAACFLFTSTRVDDVYVSVGLTAIACLFMHAQLSVWWSTAIETSGRHIGALFGLMNGIGTLGAMSTQFWFGFFADFMKARGITGRGQWEPSIVVCAVLLAVGAGCWFFIDPARKVEDPEATNA